MPTMLIGRQLVLELMASKSIWSIISRGTLLASVAAIALGGCGTSPYTGPRFTGTPGRDEVSPVRYQVVNLAEGLIGTPYRYGGNSRRGFDCSGLVQYTHRRVGVSVPRTAASQLAQARVPDRPNLLPGDLLFFNIDAQKSGHVGIYEGDGVFIHAPSSGKRVSRASLDNPYWGERLVATRTFL